MPRRIRVFTLRAGRFARGWRPAAGALLSIAALVVCGAAAAQVGSEPCGPLANGNVGPYDFRAIGKGTLETIESYHFTPRVDALIGGMTGDIGGDIGYVLHAVPNHHRALMAMMRLGEKQKLTTPVGARYTVDCYFERAIRFRRDDVVARMLYANYLVRNRREPEARAHLEEARRLGAENPFTQYNVGQVYFEMKDYDRALAQAHVAAQMGFTLPELKKRLQGVGRWVEPKPGPKAASPDAPAVAAAPAAPEPPSAAGAASEAAR